MVMVVTKVVASGINDGDEAVEFMLIRKMFFF